MNQNQELVDLFEKKKMHRCGKHRHYLAGSLCCLLRWCFRQHPSIPWRRTQRHVTSALLASLSSRRSLGCPVGQSGAPIPTLLRAEPECLTTRPAPGSRSRRPPAPIPSPGQRLESGSGRAIFRSPRTCAHHRRPDPRHRRLDPWR
jgi:hypothetical protein